MRRTARFSDAPPMIEGPAAFYNGADLDDGVRKRMPRQPYSAQLDSMAKRLSRGGFVVDGSMFTDLRDEHNTQAEIVPLEVS